MNATTEPTTPAPLSARLATMAEQLLGFADAMHERPTPDPFDAAELRSLADAITAASTDAANLERTAPVNAGELSRRSIEQRERTWADKDREPDRDTDQHGNTWRNADGEG